MFLGIILHEILQFINGRFQLIKYAQRKIVCIPSEENKAIHTAGTDDSDSTGTVQVTSYLRQIQNGNGENGGPHVPLNFDRFSAVDGLLRKMVLHFGFSIFYCIYSGHIVFWVCVSFK